mgnify:CR=1 FL=1|tara:strand:+ start:629 stop:817 length:189 start_codon:yes stop_codon:yes gene_type:complete
MSDNEETDIEFDFTLVLVIVGIFLIIFLLWFFSSTDVSYSPVFSENVIPAGYDISTAFDIVS